jgi:hypothetical protein
MRLPAQPRVTSENSPSKAPAREKPLRHFSSADAILRTDSLARAARGGLYLQQHCEGGTIGGPLRKTDSVTIPRDCTYRATERDNSANVSVQDRRLRLVCARGWWTTTTWRD